MANPKIALVTGASRGVGAGIARGLGSLGYTVYVTGRAETIGAAKGWDGAPLPGTIADTARQVSEAGGKGIPVRCDHSDDAQVARLFQQIEEEQGRLDILVNHAPVIHHQLIETKPCWEKELAAQNIFDVGLRSAYVASWHAARMMVREGRGLIAFSSSFGGSCYMHGPAYGAQKAGVDKLAHDMEVDFRDTGVTVVSIWLGPQRTERALNAAKVHPEQYEEFLKIAENPEYTGLILDAISKAPNRAELSGETLISAEIGKALGLLDAGRQPPSYRDMFGGPRPKNPVVVY